VDPLPLKLHADRRSQDQPVTIERHRARFHGAAYAREAAEFPVVNDLAVAYLKRAAVGSKTERADCLRPP
jgi:hypothetical protein